MMRLICIFAFALTASIVQADSSVCSRRQAGEELWTFYEEVTAYLDSDMEPLLEKQKAGYVWVARPASPRKLLSSPAGYRKLIQEMRSVITLLQESPMQVCREIRMLRKKYEF